MSAFGVFICNLEHLSSQNLQRSLKVRSTVAKSEYFSLISFNCIDLPPYTSYTIMKQKLLLSISEGVGSFLME